MSASASPALSVILVATHDYPLIRSAVRNLTRQRDVAVELVIAAPQALVASITEEDRGDLTTFAGWQHVVIPDDTPFDEARARGVRAARAPIVAFTEDHSFPQPGWAAALVAAFSDGVSVVGPVVENANPGSAVSWANFLLEYGEWMPPGRPHGHAHLPGHNSAYRRDVLLALDDRLTRMIEAESVLHWALAGDGHRLAQEPRAVTRHTNFSRFTPSVELRYHLGRQFAARRSGQWSVARRAAYAVAFPLVALVRVARVARLGIGSRDLPAIAKALPTVAAMVTVSSVGEAVGYVTRQAGSSAAYLSDIEHDRRRFMRDEDLDSVH
ncbi:MAG: hypothetical protein K0S86_2979 [Geminicoccaceae bacterium]|nr:hypothetical protein [Geminicoccaceae bacterium]